MGSVLAVAVLIAAGACGGDDDGPGGAANEPDSAATAAEPEDDDGDTGGTLDVDNCSLLTDAEASELNGSEVRADEDSPMGCPYIAPGGTLGEVVVTSARYEGDLTAMADEWYPDAASVIPIDGVGEQAVAIATPAGDAVAAIFARQDDLVVVLVTVFTPVEPDDPASVQAAAEFAGIALERLVAAA